MLEDLPLYLTTKELADLIRVKERKVYDLVATGDVPHSRATGKLLFPRDAVLAWIERAGESSGGDGPRPPVIVGSHDPLLEWALRSSECGLASLFDGSLDGLRRFAAAEGLAAGLHIPDDEGDGWNRDVVLREFKFRPVVLISWAMRRRGLILPQGNPLKIRGLGDLAGKRLARRQESAGSHVLLTKQFAKLGPNFAERVLTGPMVRDEREAAQAVFSGEADVAFGLESSARQSRLEFLPVLNERFDLLVTRRDFFEVPFQKLLAFSRSTAFADKAGQFGGYDIRFAGQVQFNGT
ncbi:excisionase family DNA binding protein [Roseibium hamelinense]|uniref:Excisionase family DNA binding protein n=1 Tax=Roseibium hamelinense TaxID=150831 RepID=A0A562TAT1_9HYPH|nr:helix-turn-helix transcriptional regulator [Roseibium hamelinense]MTI45319.1 helix-turn-helix domain-containing protein [Roseibium hamelinense]TWI90314.1 excisionase family DNA binding protein [Roseibium hamelinense]